ncbi:MAG TPA: DUF6463 family protein [Thermoanaerobaculia bacterium]|jgi:uncharacterized membrane protein HdeD (DUF308 family)
MVPADLLRLLLIPPFLIGLWIIIRRRERKVGRTLMLIGAIHILGGLIVGWEPLVRIFREGFFGEADSTLGHIPAEKEQELIFWFLLWGVMMLLLGQVVARMEGLGQTLPARLGWELAALGVVAIAVAPKGGFWWVLLPAYWIIQEPRRREGV